MAKRIAIILFLIIFSFLIYSYRMGSIGLTDPDETFYTQTAKEMIERHNFIIPFIFGHPQFEKPILFYWLLFLSFKLFGATEWAARVWPALFGTLGIVVTFLIGKSMFTRRIGVYAALMLATGFLYLGLSRVVLTDIVLTAFILLSMFFFYSGYTKPYKNNQYLFSYIFIGLAVLTKGPIGIIIPFSIIVSFFIIQKKWESLRRFLSCWQGWLSLFAVTLPWYSYISLKFGKDFLYGFFIHENLQRFFIAEHQSNNHWYFYPAVILLGMFPWSNLLPFMLTKERTSLFQPRLFLYCWFWCVLLFFTFAQSKLASYILPLFPALCLLLAHRVSDMQNKSAAIPRFKMAFSVSILVTLTFLGAFIYSIIWIEKNFPELLLLSLVIESIFAIALCSFPFLIFNKVVEKAIMVYLISVFTAVILSFSYLMPRLEGAFSDRMLVARLPEDKSTKKEILCNKMFVRGVYYYTNRPVAVIDSSKHVFYTPHPIDILSTDSELNEFFSTKKDIVCVIKETDLERINRITNGKRKNRSVYRNGNRTVIISSALHPE